MMMMSGFNTSGNKQKQDPSPHRKTWVYKGGGGGNPGRGTEGGVMCPGVSGQIALDC